MWLWSFLHPLCALFDCWAGSTAGLCTLLTASTVPLSCIFFFAGPDFDTGLRGDATPGQHATVRDLLEEVYRKAGELQLWSIVRYRDMNMMGWFWLGLAASLLCVCVSPWRLQAFFICSRCAQMWGLRLVAAPPGNAAFLGSLGSLGAFCGSFLR